MDGSNWRWDHDDRPDRDPFWPPPPPASEMPTAAIILLVAALLLASGYTLIQNLGEMVRIQNCTIQGRTNCVSIDVQKSSLPPKP
ncbi:hypothetical protein [Telmatospirillum sp.]|uniref:hypothetical protein n=1 Tax=Telmatospirillum sp. TaxID=2079197 RepID=UPI00284E29E0|nr:hypothetical protein [Telmatospirillum sp.]MDR3438433.1 hypothetical protein [Telmatospirillum sp.]